MLALLRRTATPAELCDAFLAVLGCGPFTQSANVFETHPLARSKPSTLLWVAEVAGGLWLARKPGGSYGLYSPEKPKNRYEESEAKPESVSEPSPAEATSGATSYVVLTHENGVKALQEFLPLLKMN